MRYGIVFLFLFLIGAQAAEAQSTLEYATLTEAVTAATAAGAGKKDKKSGVSGAVTGLQEAQASAMGRAGGLMGQVGAGMAAPPIVASPSEAPVEAASVAPATEPTPVPAEQKGEAPVAAGNARVLLKDGRVVEGKLVEQTRDRVRLETGGVEVTFFSEEIAKIET